MLVLRWAKVQTKHCTDQVEDRVDGKVSARNMFACSQPWSIFYVSNHGYHQTMSHPDHNASLKQCIMRSGHYDLEVI